LWVYFNNFYYISSPYSLRLKLDPQQQPQNYTKILEISFIKDINEQASPDELDFITRIIDKIPSEVDWLCYISFSCLFLFLWNRFAKITC
jgi:hypothetical protein